jgi:hypothetical protein
MNNIIKRYIIETEHTEFYIKAVDLQDAIDTWNGRAEDLICIKELL